MPGELIKLLCDKLRGKNASCAKPFDAHLLRKAVEEKTKLSRGNWGGSPVKLTQNKESMCYHAACSAGERDIPKQGVSWTVNSPGTKANTPRNTKQKDADHCMQRRQSRRGIFAQGILQAKKDAGDRPDAQQPGYHHTFHMPHRSPLVRNNDYICATKPFKMDKAGWVRPRGAARSCSRATARGYCWGA